MEYINNVSESQRLEVDFLSDKKYNVAVWGRWERLRLVDQKQKMQKANL